MSSALKATVITRKTTTGKKTVGACRDRGRARSDLGDHRISEFPDLIDPDNHIVTLA